MEMLFTKENIYFPPPDLFSLFAIASTQDSVGAYPFCNYLTCAS